MTTLHDFAARMEALGPQGLTAVIRPEFERLTQDIVRRSQRGVRDIFRQRSGQLRRSSEANLEEQNGQLAIRARNRARYARAQELGGVIEPVTSKFLRIPTENAMTAQGIDKMPGPLRATAPEGFFQLVRTKAGRLMLVHDVGGRNARSEIWYWLVPRVTLPPRPFLRPAVDEAMKVASTRIAKAIRRALQQPEQGGTV